ncbi:hypothetical protein K4B79_11850 [Streptomyces lincolnensis]|uniref:DUF5994 family protein n=1 Tax=Streptomyces lincolnensis TaxID=1915 RepID=UPI001E337E43|nr:DUF5994 family protein [Streptomyces lincolnensis]MCD7438916.1 hypothetical protein [Streptomyces lincolnensis]
MEPTAEHPSAGPKRPSPPPSVRLSLAPYEAVRGGLDGAWWPYSHSLVDELPVLVEAVGGVGSITRVVLGIDLWPDIPHRIPVGGHFVTVGWFVSGHEQNEILLCSYSEGFRTLLVVPPATAADAGAWLLSTSVPVDVRRTATELLAIATARFDVPSAAESITERNLFGP